MTGETNLSHLLKDLKPVLNEGEYLFISIKGGYDEIQKLEPVCVFTEAEGLSLVIAKSTAEQYNFPTGELFSWITLSVYSSLSAVGLTAAVSNALAAAGISANVIAACHHDPIFVPSSRAEDALQVLQSLS